jgi:hypothetical protein
MKASDLFVTFYNQIGRAFLRNRPTFISRLFKAAGSTHDVTDEKNVYTQSDYRYKLCSGTKPLSIEIKRSFPNDIVDIENLTRFFVDCMNKKNESCFALIKSFGLNEENGCNAKFLATALAVQFKSFIDDKENDEVPNIISFEYERLFAEAEKGETITEDNPSAKQEESHAKYTDCECSKEFHINSNDISPTYQQNNFNQTIKVEGNNNTVNGFVFNLNKGG